jgi:uncharacterized protein (TIGR03437 family)
MVDTRLAFNKLSRLGLVALMACVAASGQSIVTFAGGQATPTGAGDGGPATSALMIPSGVAVDASGNLFIADAGGNRIRKVSTNGIVTTVAGSGLGASGFSGDGGPATAALLNNPTGVAVDASGNLFIADCYNERIRKVSGSGIITTVAGTVSVGLSVFSGDGGPAISATMYYPYSVAVDALGNLFIADTQNNRIRKVSANGIITTVAGNGPNAQPGGFSGDSGPATAASLSYPYGVAVDASGNLFIADTANNRIRKVSASGIITTVAGSGPVGYAPSGTGNFSGDGGSATSATLNAPFGVAVDTSGNLFIVDYFNNRIRKVSASGIITTVAGSGTASFSGDGGPATSALLNNPTGVAVDTSGNLFIADYNNNRIRKVSANGIITTVAGSGPTAGSSGDGGPATSAIINQPSSVAVDASGDLFIAESFKIRKVTASGIITTVAGSGTQGFSGDGGSATSATLNGIGAVAVDASGNLFIADTGNNRIRKVSASGIITTVAGNGASTPGDLGNGGFSGDGGPATSAALSNPNGVAVDTSGNLFIADLDNNRIRKVSASGIITTYAGSGTPGVSGTPTYYGGFSGDGGPATAALLSYPSGVAVDASGNLFIADYLNNRIRKVTASSGIITTVAGSGAFGWGNTCYCDSGSFSGDGGPATSATLHLSGVAVDASGNLFIADSANNRIREVAAASGIIATVAGNGSQGFSGDGGPATSATLNGPNGVAVDASGNLFIADTGNNRIREVLAAKALGGIQNAASYATGAVSPGEMVVLYGAGMGPAALAYLQVDSGSGLLETTVAGTAVLFNGFPAPIIYTSAGQVAAIVPYEIAGVATAQILVNYQGKYVAAGTAAVAPSAPGIFTVNSGIGQAAALNQDASVNSASNPAAAGSVIVLYLTGEGQTAPQGVNGKIASAAPLPSPVLPVTITIGGQPATYFYAGAAPDEVAGVMQINANIPTGVTGNAVPVSVQIGTVSTQKGVTIAVQ